MTHSPRPTWRSAVLLGCSALLSACATTGPGRVAAVPPGARYVAMGSSYAAGPGVTTSADQPPTRCARSADNYAHLIARRLDLRLTDVSCSGAKTTHILGSWNELPPQVDALTSDTRLVTVTIGGNDVGFVGRLGSESCRSFPTPPAGTPGGKCPEPPTVSEEDWAELDAAMRGIVSEVRRRAPVARLVFVDYLTVLPATGTCRAVPLTPEQADASRATARRLASLTARVAAETGAEVFKASDLSRDHGACAAEPWMAGFPQPDEPGFVPYHPNAMGMAAIADTLSRRLR